MTISERVQKSVSSLSDDLVKVSHQVHRLSELAFEEFESSKLLAAKSEKAFDTVDLGVAGLETAFVAKRGNGPLHISICAEYDALPGVGHACGHNIIAASALGASLLLSPFVDELGITLSLMGTPAEEGGGGKIIMMDKGLFEEEDLAMMIHPAPVEGDRMPCAAASHIEVNYQGKEAHAAAFPQVGINAMDAMTIAQVAIGLLRQSFYPGEMVHGFVTNGGKAPNIIPAHTSADYVIRANSLKEMESLTPRVRACFEGGAVATGAKLTFEERFPPYSEFVVDEDLASVYREMARVAGRDIPDSVPSSMRASTDMGNVSLRIPSIHPIIGINSLPAVNHQPEFTAAAISADADRAVVEGALSMALTCIKVATDPTLRSAYEGGKRRRELREHLSKIYG
ncbi:MAG: M20 family metallopeptidase [Actinomycetota bacterium]|nr:M20 family metallopeptidase [Actinomycetota bacterium]